MMRMQLEQSGQNTEQQTQIDEKSLAEVVKNPLRRKKIVALVEANDADDYHALANKLNISRNKADKLQSAVEKYKNNTEDKELQASLAQIQELLRIAGQEKRGIDKRQKIHKTAKEQDENEERIVVERKQHLADLDRSIQDSKKVDAGIKQEQITKVASLDVTHFPENPLQERFSALKVSKEDYQDLVNFMKESNSSAITSWRSEHPQAKELRSLFSYIDVARKYYTKITAELETIQRTRPSKNLTLEEKTILDQHIADMQKSLDTIADVEGDLYKGNFTSNMVRETEVFNYLHTEPEYVSREEYQEGINATIEDKGRDIPTYNSLALKMRWNRHKTEV